MFLVYAFAGTCLHVSYGVSGAGYEELWRDITFQAPEPGFPDFLERHALPREEHESDFRYMEHRCARWELRCPGLLRPNT